jgi:rSAM/selenodomain-associated transferase 1
MPHFKNMQNVCERFIVFTRYPEPGKAKTRLIPVLGTQGAAELHRCMAEDTIGWAIQLKKYHLVTVEVRYDGGSKDLMEKWLGRNVSYLHQGSGDLGERMSRAFVEAFQAGIKFVIIAGTDCPDLEMDIVLSAFGMLRQCDVVLGPAKDGGYYLIGFRSDTFLLEAFEGIHWGSETVLEQTMNILEMAGCNIHLLSEWRDVDTFADLRELFYRSHDTGFWYSKTISYLLKHEEIFTNPGGNQKCS